MSKEKEDEREKGKAVSQQRSFDDDDHSSFDLYGEDEEDPFAKEKGQRKRCERCWRNTVHLPKTVFQWIKSWSGKTWMTIFLLMAAVVMLLLLLIFAPWQNWLGDFLDFIKYLGWWGPILLAEMYIACTLLFIPGSILTLGAGFAFEHVYQGVIAVSIGSTIGAIGAFLYGKTLLRQWVEKKIRTFTIFKAIDIAIAQKGWLIVLLLRLSPLVPFNLINYALGLTNVGLFEYALASWIGMLPATIVYVMIGHALQNVSEVLAGTTKNVYTQILFWVGLLCTVGALIIITVKAKSIISKALREAEELEKQRQINQNEEDEEKGPLNPQTSFSSISEMSDLSC